MHYYLAIALILLPVSNGGPMCHADQFYTMPPLSGSVHRVAIDMVHYSNIISGDNIVKTSMQSRILLALIAIQL